MATTNISHDSQGERDAENEFKNLLEKRSPRKSQRLATIGSDEETESPQKIAGDDKSHPKVKQAQLNTIKSEEEETKEVKVLKIDLKETNIEGETDIKDTDNAQGQNLDVEDQY